MEALSIRFGGKSINEKESLKTLVLTISNKLTFDRHVEEIKRKCEKMVGALRRLSYKLQRDTVKRITEANILNRIAYGSIIYLKPELKKVSTKKHRHKELTKVINATARIIFGKIRMDKISSKNLSKMAEMKTLNQIVLQQLTKEAWAINNDQNHAIYNIVDHPNKKRE